MKRSSPVSPGSESAADLAGRTVLVVEDDRPTRNGLALLLAGQGYRVLAVGTFEDARRAFLTEGPDLVITDIRLGAHNGLQLLALAPRRVPFIILTGFADPVLEADARRLGAAFVLKPCAPAVLMDLVRTRLNQSTGAGAFLPTRQWLRKPLTDRVTARVDNTSVRLLDVSYGGASFEVGDDVGDVTTSLRVTLPGASVAVPFHVCWTRRTAEGGYVAGGSVSEEHRTQWREVVDSLE